MVVGKSTSVEFKSGMVLSLEMLQQLEYQTHLNELQYQDYPDGIIYGLTVYEADGKLFFSPGLVKLMENYFYIHSSIDVYSLLDIFDDNCDFDGDWVNNTVSSAIVLEVDKPSLINEGVCVTEIQAKLVDKTAIQNNMLCLAEFQYHKGNRGWNINNANLEDQLLTTGTVFSLLNVHYSLNGESVFSPYIYDLMRKRIELIESPLVEDIALLLILNQNRLVSFDTLRQWFHSKKMNVDFQSRSDIISKFMEVLSFPKSNNSPAPVPSQQPTAKKKFGM